MSLLKLKKGAEVLTRIVKETGLTHDQVASVLAAAERIREEETRAKADARKAKMRDWLRP